MTGAWTQAHSAAWAAARAADAGECGGWEPRVAAALAAFVRTARDAQLVVDDTPGSPPDSDTLEDAARRLAAASGHPRYTDPSGLGWPALLEGAANVAHAHRQATSQPSAQDPHTAAQLRADRERLLRHIHEEGPPA